MSDVKLVPEVKSIWLDALKSGKYRKAKQAMVSPRGKGFCCLGVLTMEYCEAHGIEAAVDLFQQSIRVNPVESPSYATSLAKPVAAWAFGPTHGWRERATCGTLAMLNDTKPGYPVDYIEENL